MTQPATQQETPASETQTFSARWTAHEAHPQDDDEVLRLFEEVFGHAMPKAQWLWKYADAPVRGSLLRRDGEVIAFYGGMPRPVQGPERVYPAVQNGDVMVKPSQRGAFTRRGPIADVTAAFFEHIGPHRRFEFGYGFPNERAFRASARRGLYIEGDRLHTFTWSALDPNDQPWWTRQVELDAGSIGVVDTLWAQLRSDWHELYIPVRDAARWRYRFLDHPTVKYRVLLVCRRFFGKPLAALVLREHPTHVEWLDYAGPRANVRHAANAVRRFAGACGGKPVSALLSQSIADDFSQDFATAVRDSILVPFRMPEPGWPQPYPWERRLWLMGGDADFM